MSLTSRTAIGWLAIGQCYLFPNINWGWEDVPALGCSNPIRGPAASSTLIILFTNSENDKELPSRHLIGEYFT